jgi:hypothetical protein
MRKWDSTPYGPACAKLHVFRQPSTESLARQDPYETEEVAVLYSVLADRQPSTESPASQEPYKTEEAVVL